MLELEAILKKYWGHDAFRPKQKEIIESVMSGKDTLALLPTGGGKSICFQVPAMAKEGICIVISPLIALMKDQVENLQKIGISAQAIYSGMHPKAIDACLDNAVYGQYKFLYVSPERLTTSLFIERLKQMPVNLLAVDEAHCISQWGYDFRPAYLKIAEIRPFLPKIPILALTASATPKVQKDIQEKLDFGKNAQQFFKSFDRPNLIYAAVENIDKRGKALALLQKVKGTAIVYVSNRKATKEVSLYLKNKGISADFYHGGLTTQERDLKQSEWIQNKTRVVVCTNAFGMGIDKPDVRLVIHLNLPESLEAYYQEAGRGGRDLKRSFAIAVINESDRKRLREAYAKVSPENKALKRVYNILCNFLQIPYGAGKGQLYTLDLFQLCKQYHYEPLEFIELLEILAHNQLLHLMPTSFQQSQLKIKLNYEDLYRFQVEHKTFEPFIKMILRLHEGVLDYFVQIDERQMALKLKVRPEFVKKNLFQLQKKGIVDYQPQNKLPQVLLTEERLPEANIKIDRQYLLNLQEKRQMQIKAVEAFFFEHNGCRSQYLLDYFGETLKGLCGHCDYCLKRTQQAESITKVQEKVQEMLSTYEQMPINTIREKFPEKDWPNVKEALQLLQEADAIYIHQDRVKTKKTEEQ